MKAYVDPSEDIPLTIPPKRGRPHIPQDQASRMPEVVMRTLPDMMLAVPPKRRHLPRTTPSGLLEMVKRTLNKNNGKALIEIPWSKAGRILHPMQCFKNWTFLRCLTMIFFTVLVLCQRVFLVITLDGSLLMFKVFLLGAIYTKAKGFCGFLNCHQFYHCQESPLVRRLKVCIIFWLVNDFIRKIFWTLFAFLVQCVFRWCSRLF